MVEHGDTCCHPPEAHGKKKPWFQNLLFLSVLATLLLLGASFIFPFLESFRHSLLGYLKMMGRPVALGFLAGGLVDYFVPGEYVSKILASRNKRTVFYAAGLGFLMSACSHGILALSMELHKKGASGPAVVSFLLASPWANLPITFLLIGFFGWRGALIILTALVVAVITGLIFQGLDRKGWIERNQNTIAVDSAFSIRRDIAKRLREITFSFSGFIRMIQGIGRGMAGLAQMVLGWVLVGILLASFAGAFIPPHIFHRFFGPTFTGLLVTMALATLLEVCSEGTSPLAFEIYKQTGAFGNAFAFLMGGVVTDYTEIGLVWINLGKRTALWMLAVTLPQVLLLGWLFNLFF